jgi:RNA polymerase sigma-70 factor (ECF subfamily)
MAEDSTTQLQAILDRMAVGDVTARLELIGRAYDRLRRLAQRMLRQFPRVRSFEDTGDLLHDSLPRLTRALETVPPASVAEFFRLAGKQMRWELLDLVQRHGGEQPPAGQGATPPHGDTSAGTPSAADPPDSTHNPPTLASWTEFHEAVAALPEPEREVFELLYYHELTQAEAGAVLQVAEITVRRRWLAARRQLGKFLRQEHGD